MTGLGLESMSSTSPGASDLDTDPNFSGNYATLSFYNE